MLARATQFLNTQIYAYVRIKITRTIKNAKAEEEKQKREIQISKEYLFKCYLIKMHSFIFFYAKLTIKLTFAFYFNFFLLSKKPQKQNLKKIQLCCCFIEIVF